MGHVETPPIHALCPARTFFLQYTIIRTNLEEIYGKNNKIEIINFYVKLLYYLILTCKTSILFLKLV